MRSKSYKAVREKITDAQMQVADAIQFLKENKRAKFDETVEVHVALALEGGKSEAVRGTVVLPGGTPKQKKVAVLTSDAKKQEEAKAAGAAMVGGEDLVSEIEKNGISDIDIIIASPDMMPKIARVAKVLGPKGLMPNPKTGTVTPDVAGAVKELAAGKVSFKMDASGNIHAALGKVSWDAEKIEKNTSAFLEAVRAAKPATHRGIFIEKVVLKTSMSPAIRIAL